MNLPNFFCTADGTLVELPRYPQPTARPLSSEEQELEDRVVQAFTSMSLDDFAKLMEKL